MSKPTYNLLSPTSPESVRYKKIAIRIILAFQHAHNISILMMTSDLLIHLLKNNMYIRIVYFESKLRVKIFRLDSQLISINEVIFKFDIETNDDTVVVDVLNRII